MQPHSSTVHLFQFFKVIELFQQFAIIFLLTLLYPKEWYYAGEFTENEDDPLLTYWVLPMAVAVLQIFGNNDLVRNLLYTCFSKKLGCIKCFKSYDKLTGGKCRRKSKYCNANPCEKMWLLMTLIRFIVGTVCTIFVGSAIQQQYLLSEQYALEDRGGEEEWRVPHIKKKEIEHIGIMFICFAFLTIYPILFFI